MGLASFQLIPSLHFEYCFIIFKSYKFPLHLTHSHVSISAHLYPEAKYKRLCHHQWFGVAQSQQLH